MSQWEGHFTFKTQPPNERSSWRERLKARRSGTHNTYRVKNSVLPPIQGRPGFPEPDAPNKDALRLAIIHRVIDRPTVFLQEMTTYIHLKTYVIVFQANSNPKMSTDK